MSRQEAPSEILSVHALEPIGPASNTDQYNPYEAKGRYDDQESRVSAERPEANSTWKSVYFGISGMLGFGEKFSLLCFIIFGGALIGFCFARVLMMIPSNVETVTMPGEWYWYRQRMYKQCIFIHIYLTIIAGVFAIFQFIPMIRRRKIVLHRINGYFVLCNLTPGTVAGSIVARRAFGGELNSQAAFMTVGSMIGFAAYMGISNVKRTRKHRKWMLRTVAYTSSVITARIIAIITRTIISFSGSYYAVWTCDEISFLLKSATAAVSRFPVCGTAAGADPRHIYVPVHASVYEDRINFGSTMRVSFGMGMWIGILIHVVAVEIYIRATESYQWPPRSPEAVNNNAQQL